MHITDKKTFYVALALLVFSVSGLTPLWKLVLTILLTLALMVFSVKWKWPIIALPKKLLSRSAVATHDVIEKIEEKTGEVIASVIPMTPEVSHPKKIVKHPRKRVVKSPRRRPAEEAEKNEIKF